MPPNDVFNRHITGIKGIGTAAAGHFERLGISTIKDLISHYPREWEDRGRKIPLKNWDKAFVCTKIKILAHDWFGSGYKKTLKVYVEDESARASLICFNRPFLKNQLLPGREFHIYGKFDYRFGEIQSSSFELEPIDNRPFTIDSRVCLILPVYPLTAGINQLAMRKFMYSAIVNYVPLMENELPEEIIKKYYFLNKSESFRAIHFPFSFDELEKAKKTLVYEELFQMEMMIGQRAMNRKTITRRKTALPSKKINSSKIISAFTPLQQRLIERLPFSLTSSQKDAVLQMNDDMDGPYAMARLLQGDVGSGKTLVSFLAALKAIEGGAQAALMAPTELLARQHAENAAAMLEPLGIRIAFLSGNIKSAGRKQLLSALQDGNIDLVAGTHALFSKDVEYKNLGFVVIDEQHRFGVLQRQAIISKAKDVPPDFLMMSATPIPQSLALTVFGDLDVTIINEMPAGRKPVKTHLALESGADRVYDFVRRELKAGNQAYFVYPLIEGDSEEKDAELKDAVSMAERLSKEVFPGHSLALLHSRVEENKKREIMDSFRKGEIKILAATSVVEVGVDVKGASCMVIEHAERFGLAALHQLRGRVGRGDRQSYCFLVYSENLTDDAKARLKIMLNSNDGFVIAEEDLKLRGPGLLGGIEQSGFLKLGIADPFRDVEVLEMARKDAFTILDILT